NSSQISGVDWTIAGHYQLQYAIRDAETGLLTMPMVGHLYRGKSGNQSPRSFTLQEPASNATVNSVGLFNWDTATDPDNDPMTYTLTIGSDSALNNRVYRREGMQASYAVVDFKKLTVATGNYYWRVEAVDFYGAVTSSPVGSFSLSFPNDIPAVLAGYLYNNSDSAAISGASVTLDGKPVRLESDGSLVTMMATQGGTLKISKDGYQTKEINLGAAEAGSVNQLAIGLQRVTATVAAPTGLDLSSADDSGKSTSDNITKVTKALTISGSGKAKAVVTLLDGEVSLGTIAVSSSGKWSKDVALSEGSHTIQATQKLGNDVSDASAALMITVDTTAPDAPSLPDLADEDDNGADNSNNITSLTKGLNFSGSGEMGATVTLFADKNKNGRQESSEKALMTAIVDENGLWRSKDLAMAIGTYSLRAFQTDLAGNAGPMSEALGLSIVKAGTAKRAEALFVVSANL
ncbi:MAG: hypothetical protein HQL58_14040, partial [Magnetococcales bacterium]|nr:hypothetical protein [Magnetococcales bacterium]